MNDDHMWEWYIKAYGSRNPTKEHKDRVDSIRSKTWSKWYEKYKNENLTNIKIKSKENIDISDIVEQYDLSFYLGNAIKSLIENNLENSIFYINKEISRLKKDQKVEKLTG